MKHPLGKQKIQLKRGRGRLFFFVTLSLIVLGGCSSPENPNQNNSEEAGTKNNSTKTEPKSLPATADSKTPTMSNSFEAINREMAQDSKERRDQENKRMQNRLEELKISNAHESKENAKDREMKMLESLMPIVSTGITTKGLMFMSLPDEAKCNHYSSTIKSITHDTDRAIDYKRSELSSKKHENAGKPIDPAKPKIPS